MALEFAGSDHKSTGKLHTGATFVSYGIGEPWRQETWRIGEPWRQETWRNRLIQRLRRFRTWMRGDPYRYRIDQINYETRAVCMVLDPYPWIGVRLWQWLLRSRKKETNG